MDALRPRPRRALLVTADLDLLDDVLRLGAAAGAELEVAADITAARASWATAPVVMVGGDLAEAAAGSRLPRRDDVVIVGTDLDDAGVWRRAVGLGADHVVFLPDAEAWLVDLLADAAEGRPRAAPVVGVLGGRGGAGATSLASALAITGVRAGHRTMLVDADPLGGGIDLVLGGESAGGLRWPELAGTRGRVSGTALRDALPRVDELTVLSWDRGDALSIPPEAMAALLAAAERGSDLVVVDLPRRADDAARCAMERAAVVLLVVPAEVRAAAAAARVATSAGLYCRDLRVVVRGPAPAGLPAEAVADSLGLPLAGSIKAEPGLAAALERGEPPARRGRGPLASFCVAFLDELQPPAGRPAAA